MEDLEQNVLSAVKVIRDRIPEKPDVGIVLGSGLGNLAYEIQDPIVIPYNEIPFFRTSTVEGHEGKLVFGKIYDKNVIVMVGRLHYYEGFSMEEVVFPIRVMALLGIHVLVLTNAAGGINPRFKVGDLMLITDHINISGLSPLRGKNYDLFGIRFPAMNNIYDKYLQDIAKSVANEIKLSLQEGVYAFMPGPQYETDAEVKMLSILGASAVGMSTVPEAVAATHSGLDVLGISCITNVAGVEGETASHNEVLDAANSVEDSFKQLIMDVVGKL